MKHIKPNMNFINYRKVFTDPQGYQYYRILVNKPLTVDMFVVPFPPSVDVEKTLQPIINEWNEELIKAFQKHAIKHFSRKFTKKELQAKAKELYKLHEDDFLNRPLPTIVTSQTDPSSKCDDDKLMEVTFATIEYSRNKPIKI
jgi:hypothetical protein